MIINKKNNEVTIARIKTVPSANKAPDLTSNHCGITQTQMYTGTRIDVVRNNNLSLCNFS